MELWRCKVTLRQNDKAGNRCSNCPQRTLITKLATGRGANREGEGDEPCAREVRVAELAATGAIMDIGRGGAPEL